jgi:hypothetical protein
MNDWYWPIPEVSLDEKRWTGKRSEVATQRFRAILSATEPFRTVIQFPYPMKFLSLIVCFLAFATTLANGDGPPDCDVSAVTLIPFSSEDATDRLSVVISGSPCYEASLALSITTEDGYAVYSYEAPFEPHVATQWDYPGLAEVAQGLVNRFLDDISFSRTRDLPEWIPKDEYYEANYQELRVDRAYYDKLRENDWPVYTHLIHYEGWKVIAYDRNKGQTVVVSQGGL